MNTCREMLKKVEKLNVNVVCVYVAYLIKENLFLIKKVSDEDFEKLCDIILDYDNNYMTNKSLERLVDDLCDLYLINKCVLPTIKDFIEYQEGF